jgi:hypothetical protein
MAGKSQVAVASRCTVRRKCDWELQRSFQKTRTKKLKIKIYRTIILPVVLYGCETWSLTLREERRLREC